MSTKKYSKPIDLRKFERDTSWRIDIASKQKAIAAKLAPHVFVVDHCPICESKSSEHFVTIYDYPYRECKECGHLYSSTPPRVESLAALYTEDESGVVLSAQSQIYIREDLFQRRVDEIASPKALFASDLIEEKGKWIDVGAGVGDLVLSAKRLGWEAVGYESDNQEVEFAQSMGANVINLFLDSNNIKVLNEATIVSTINVLEHVVDPKTLVKMISDNIPPNSYYLFEVPRFPSVSAFANKCFPDLAARNIYSPDHLHLFTDKSAAIMLKSAGFTTISTWFFGQDIYELFGNCMANAGFSNHSLIDTIMETTNAMQSVVDQHGLSDTMLVLARKNS